MQDDSAPPRPRKSASHNLTAEFERLLAGVDSRRPGAPAPLSELPPFEEAASSSDGPSAEALPGFDVPLPIPAPYGHAIAGGDAGPALPDLPALPPVEGSWPEDLPDFPPGPPSPPLPPGRALEDVIEAIDEAYAAKTFRQAPELPIREAAPLREKFVLFSLGDTTFAVPIRNVREMDRAPTVTPVPGVPPWLKGVANLRGDILSVVDLKGFFGADGETEPRRMLVVASGDGEVVTALLVDAVPGMARFAAPERQAPDAVSDERIRPYVDGLVEHDGHLVTLLDVDRILRAPDLAQFQGA